ncbi:MAG: helix-turn-helix transcriptional regulator [Pseudomonadota bacterium]
MKNRIREYRKQRGWTIRDLSLKLRTSEATISRLETHQIAMSTDWLMRFGDVFGVHPADLLEKEDRPRVRYLGAVDRDGRLSAIENSFIDLPPLRPESVAIRLREDDHPFTSGDRLFGRPLQPDAHAEAAGRYCFGQMKNGDIVIGRLIATAQAGGGPDTFQIVPARKDQAPRLVSESQWVAVIHLRVSVFDEAWPIHDVGAL